MKTHRQQLRSGGLLQSHGIGWGTCNIGNDDDGEEDDDDHHHRYDDDDDDRDETEHLLILLEIEAQGSRSRTLVLINLTRV